RNTMIDDIEIKEGDIMALGDNGILAVGKNIEPTVLEALEAMVEEESELVTVYYGKDVKEEDAKTLKEKAEELFSHCEVELHAGGQPIYYYLISVE
ncbi:MAG: DAK2 domain-containing protein, partial [Lacrimispora celerecrescens]|nr:DAK2 domain-containing protein [Lacrimispora celerecrescens]